MIGRTGSAAVQVAKALGATVIATARSGAKARFCTEQGADHVIDISDPAWRERFAAATQGRGIDVVYDTVRGGGIHRVNGRARAGCTGPRRTFASGTIAGPDAQDMLLRDYSIADVLSRFCTEAERASTLQALTAMLAKGQIAPPVTAVHPFEDAPRAIADRATDRVGQTVVTP